MGSSIRFESKIVGSSTSLEALAVIPFKEPEQGIEENGNGNYADGDSEGERDGIQT